MERETHPGSEAANAALPTEAGSRSRSWFLLLFLLVSLLFWANADHRQQQGIWNGLFVPLGQELLTEGRYAAGAADGQETASYPLWGYAVLTGAAGLTGDPGRILWFQYLLLAIAFFMFHRLQKGRGGVLLFDREVLAANLPPRLRKAARLPGLVGFLLIGILVFFSFQMSVKWPGAISAFLLLSFAICHRKGWYGAAGALLGLAFNFRGEALIFYAAYLLWSLVRGRYAVLVGVLFLLPWMLFQYQKNNVVLPTTSNGGGVLYISLGQLPGNAWERAYRDEEAWAHVNARGIASPWSLAGDRVLKAAFLDDVADHPLEYGRKIAYLSLWAWIGGLYAPEFDSGEGVMTGDEWRRFVGALAAGDGAAWAQLPARLPTVAAMVWGRALLALLLILGAARLLRRPDPIGGIILLQFLLCVFVQWEPRHMGQILILFLFLLFQSPSSTDRPE